MPVAKSKKAAGKGGGEEQELTGWQKKIDDVKDDLQVLKSIWFHPLKKSGTHAERLDAFYAPQARQCTDKALTLTHTHTNTHTYVCV